MAGITRGCVTGGTAAASALALSLSAFTFAPSANARDGSIEDKSAEEIVEAATETLQNARSVRIELDAKDSDGAMGTDLTSMNMTLDRDGNCAGTIGKDGGSVELIKRGDKVWIKPDAAFWKAEAPGPEGEAAYELIKNRYVMGSADDPMLKDTAELCDLSMLMKENGERAEEARNLRKAGVTTVDGTRVIEVKGTEDGNAVALYVAAEGKPYLVRATEKGKDGDATATFTKYDEPVPSKTPSPDETVDLSGLEGDLRST